MTPDNRDEQVREGRACKGQNCMASASNGYKHSSECLFEYRRNLASGVASVEVGVNLDSCVSCVEWRGQKIDLAKAVADAARYLTIRNPPPKGDAMCAWSTTEDGVLSSCGKHDGPLTGDSLDAALDKTHRGNDGR